MKYPIGIQHFESLRQDGFVYVDKTRIIHDIVSDGRYYFLSRPRRFGKSLLISTLKAYFEGRKDLFQGLAMEQLEQEWRVHPVLRLDLNTEKYDALDSVDKKLDREFKVWENLYGADPAETTLPMRFEGIIQRAYEKTGERVVILVDEYDKPLLQAISNKSLQDEYRATLKAVYGALKSMDGCIRFALLTGVTKFSKVSVFSDLNNLNDISMDHRYTEICGISEKELHQYFQEDIQKMAGKDGVTYEDMSERLRQNYDGYHFAPNTVGMYNPFSILNVLSRHQFGSYWFETGTPTYLVELMKEVDLNPSELSGYEASASELDSIQIKVDNPIAVLYQSGYLTIKDYDARFRTYTLDYPNDEVKEGFVNFLVPYYTYSKSANNATIIGSFVKSLERGDVERVMDLLQSFMADIPYELVRNLEVHYQNVIYIITKLMGLYVQAEYRTSRGRIDLTIGTDKYVYIIELKLDGSAEEALAQINEKGYALPFAVDGREVVKIGANITSETRNLERWVVEMGNGERVSKE